MRRASITINSKALTDNLARVKQLAPASKVLAMVKANAYGHGIENCIPALDDADALGFASYEEALKARQFGWSKSVVVIEGAFSENQWRHCIDMEFMCVVHHPQQLEWAMRHLPTSHSPSKTIWLKVNTGMNRLGFDADETLQVAKKLKASGYQMILISHFANADVSDSPLNHQQITLFEHLLTQLQVQVDPSIKASLCNSAAIIHFASQHYDWVRPGIMLYGSSPIIGVNAKTIGIKSVMTLTASIIAIKEVTTGAKIGYGSIYSAPRTILKGIVSMGYGDGYPRVVSQKAWVGLKLNDTIYKCPIIGRISMDMMAIDLSEVINPAIGNEVVLWGENHPDSPSIDIAARHAGTISYELLCRMSTRPTRHVL